MQVILVAIVIFFPQTVTVFLDKEVAVDVDKVKLEMPADMQPAQDSPVDMENPFGNAPEPDASAPAAAPGPQGAASGTQ